MSSLQTLPPGWAVHTQSWARPGGKVKFAHIILVPGYMPFGSGYRYGSDESAMRAGLVAAADLKAAFDEVASGYPTSQ